MGSILTFSMPNKHAAIKDLRKNHRRAARNARLKTHVKALERNWKPLLKEGKTTEVREAVLKLQKTTAKAAKKHVIHRNKAARLMSRAHRALNKAAK